MNQTELFENLKKLTRKSNQENFLLFKLDVLRVAKEIKQTLL